MLDNFQAKRSFEALQGKQYFLGGAEGRFTRKATVINTAVI
jgi:hypothetical protein